MAKEMSRAAFADAALSDCVAHKFGNAVGDECSAKSSQEEATTVGRQHIARAGVGQITANPIKRTRSNWYVTIFSPLALADENDFAAEIDITDVQARQLGAADCGRVERLEHGPIPKADASRHIWDVEDSFDLPDAEHVPWDSSGLSRENQLGGRVDRDPPSSGQPVAEAGQAAQVPPLSLRGEEPTTGLGSVREVGLVKVE